jgi:hypothetical protein
VHTPLSIRWSVTYFPPYRLVAQSGNSRQATKGPVATSMLDMVTQKMSLWL